MSDSYPPPFPATLPAAGDPVTAPGKLSTGTWVTLVIGGLLVIAGVTGLSLVLYTNPVAAQIVRDIVIVLLGLVAVVIGAALVVLIAQVAMLTHVLRHEIGPVLWATRDTARQLQDTAHTIRGTTSFLSESVVSPVVRAYGLAAGARAGWRYFTSTLFSLGDKR